MKWLEKLIEKWNKFIKDTAEANEKMWQGKVPSCCNKDKGREE